MLKLEFSALNAMEVLELGGRRFVLVSQQEKQRLQIHPQLLKQLDQVQMNLQVELVVFLIAFLHHRSALPIGLEVNSKHVGRRQVPNQKKVVVRQLRLQVSSQSKICLFIVLSSIYFQCRIRAITSGDFEFAIRKKRTPTNNKRNEQKSKLVD